MFSASVTTRSPVSKYIIGFECWFLEYTSNFVLLEDDTARCGTGRKAVEMGLLTSAERSIWRRMSQLS